MPQADASQSAGSSNTAWGAMPAISTSELTLPRPMSPCRAAMTPSTAPFANVSTAGTRPAKLPRATNWVMAEALLRKISHVRTSGSPDLTTWAPTLATIWMSGAIRSRTPSGSVAAAPYPDTEPAMNRANEARIQRRPPHRTSRYCCQRSTNVRPFRAPGARNTESYRRGTPRYRVSACAP